MQGCGSTGSECTMGYAPSPSLLLAIYWLQPVSLHSWYKCLDPVCDDGIGALAPQASTLLPAGPQRCADLTYAFLLLVLLFLQAPAARPRQQQPQQHCPASSPSSSSSSSSSPSTTATLTVTRHSQ
jgi:hypothetical protein